MKFFGSFILFFVVATTVSAKHTLYSLTWAKYTLLSLNEIEVTEFSAMCKNSKSAYVTWKVTGELHELSDDKTNFSGNEWKYRMSELDSEEDDEQGYVVGSVFGGLIESWNLVPQHLSVNRWDEFEKWTREQLGKDNGSPVEFTIWINYLTKTGCRPISFEIYASSEADKIGYQAKFDNGPFRSFAVDRNSSKSGKT